MIVGMTRWWLPLVCGLLQLVSVSVGSSTEPPGWAASVSGLLGLVAGLALVARRRYPMVVLLVAVAGQVTQVMIAQPVFPVVTTVAVFTVARSVLLTARSPVGPAAALSGAVVAVAGSVALAGQAALAAPYALLLLVGILTGLTVAVRAGRAAAARREAMHAERLRIARDLHDTVGHGLGAITVQAGAGRLAVSAGAPEEATRALQAIEEAGRAVLRDVRWMVGMLRDDQDRPGVTAIGGLVDTARRAGLDVTLDADEVLPSVTPEAAEAAYRIVQEAITNVLRHSTARAARVRLTVNGDALQVLVHDAGPPTTAECAAPGHGQRGMRERAAAVGGRMVIGPDQVAGGWSVQAWLPIQGRAR
jgi:signal transduction histidine kinase